MEKHTPYFKVLEALQKGHDCALCVLEKESLKNYLDSFLYENVNDPGAREALRASRGYCPHHAHHLAGFHDPLALSILYQDQASLAVEFLKKYGAHQDLASLWAKHEVCPVCRQALQIRRHYLGILIEGLRESEMREALLDRLTLCWMHSLLTMDAVHDGEIKRRMTALIQERLSGLGARLGQYCQDCQKNAEGEVVDSPHSFAWKEAVETFAGQKEVFEP